MSPAAVIIRIAAAIIFTLVSLRMAAILTSHLKGLVKGRLRERAA